jgi:hypothetical protein
MIHSVVSPLMAAGLMLIGVVTLVAPHTAAWHFGLPVPAEQKHGLAFVRATGGRDIIMGGVLGVLLLHRDPQLASTIAFAFWITATAGALDLVLVAGSGRRGRPLYTHAAGTLLLLATGWLERAAL